ncbi:MAG: sugar phosphate isomerase/epimerase [Candidatus Hydrogenedentota bacterium]
MPNPLTSTSTLGCPKWSLETIARNLADYGYDAVDFRGLGEHLDVTTAPAFTGHLAESKRMLADAGLVVSCISSSIRICERDRLEENLEEARRTIALATELGAPYVRVFGGGDVEAFARPALADTAAETIERILAMDGAAMLHWCLETHDHWVGADDVALLLDKLPAPRVGVVWDIGHTPRITKERPSDSWAAYGTRVLNTHFKDAVYDPHHPQAMADGWRYVYLGQGSLPLREAVQVLALHGYDGYLTLEHEKRWHPELSEPEDMFPKALSWFKETWHGAKE